MSEHSDEFVAHVKYQNDIPLSLDQLDLQRSDDAIIPIVLEHARELVDMERLPTMPSIHVGIVDDDDVNASAPVENGIGYIKINSGAIRVIFDAASRLLAHSDIFPHIGNPTAELGRKTWHDGLFDNYKTLLTRRGRVLQLHDIQPHDPVRQDYAFQLAIQTLRFLIIHEIAHIRRGHSGYYEGRHGICLLERDQHLEIKVLPMDIQATEIDADRYAFMRTFMIQNTRSGEFHFDPDATRGWYHSISLFFWQFAEDDKLDGCHPLPLLRIVAAAAVARAILRVKAGDAAVTAFNKLEVEWLKEFSNALGVIVRPSDKLMKSLELQMSLHQSGELLKQMKLARLHWDNLCKDIQPFSYVDLNIADTVQA